MNSPFKFLDSFTISDRDNFFGREREIAELYGRVFESRILLIYGVSGTGKSSLVNCGLASKFEVSDWLPVNVRRGTNINSSLDFALTRNAVTAFKTGETITGKISSLYLDHFKPVFLIFDQFEELFIFGTDSEKKLFTETIRDIVSSKFPCRVIFIIREEFLASMTDFEEDLPDIFANRFRVEKMKRANAVMAVDGPCRVNGIQTDPDFAVNLISKLCQSGNEVDLTYLQIYLDRIFMLAAVESVGGSELRFSGDLLEKAGDVTDLLGRFLDEQIVHFDDPETCLSILKSFVSVQGTKKQMNEQEITESVRTLGRHADLSDLRMYLTLFVSLRILKERDESGRYELRHDALAMKIYDEFTVVEKDMISVVQFIENSVHVWKSKGVLLSADELDFIAPYESRLYLSAEQSELVEMSKDARQSSAKRRRRIYAVSTVILLLVFAGFTLWALKERFKSQKEEKTARANYYDALAHQVLPTDATVAFNLAEHAFSIDSNENVRKTLEDIYLKEILYKKITVYSGTSAFSGDMDLFFASGKLISGEGKVIRNLLPAGIATFSAAFSPDKKKIVIGTSGMDVLLLDTTGKILDRYPDHRSVCQAVSFSHSGNKIVTASWDSTAIIYNLLSGKKTWLKGHSGRLNSAVFSPDDKYVLTAASDNIAILWDSTGRPVQKILGQTSEILFAVFTPDGTKILTGSSDGTAQLVDLKGSVLKKFVAHGNFNCASFSADGSKFIAGHNVWDLKGNILIELRCPGSFSNVAFSQNMQYLYTASENGILKWDISCSLLKEIASTGTPVEKISYSPDGKTLLIRTTVNTLLLDLLDPLKTVVAEEHMKKDLLFSGGSSCFTPEGKAILTCSDDSIIKIISLDGKEISVVRMGSDRLTAASISPDGKTIVAGNDRGRLNFFDQGLKLTRSFSSPNPGLIDLKFSPDGKSLLTVSLAITSNTVRDNDAAIWNLDGTLKTSFKGHDSFIDCASFSPDGKFVVTGSWDKTCRIWDLKGNLLQTVRTDPGQPYSIDWSPDGRAIAAGLSNRKLTVFNSDGISVQLLGGIRSTVKAVCFSPDSRFIAAGTQDGTVAIARTKPSLVSFVRDKGFEELSVSAKLEYRIITGEEIMQSSSPDILCEAADWYALKAADSRKNTLPGLLESELALLRKIIAVEDKPDGYGTIKENEISRREASYPGILVRICRIAGTLRDLKIDSASNSTLRKAMTDRMLSSDIRDGLLEIGNYFYEEAGKNEKDSVLLSDYSNALKIYRRISVSGNIYDRRITSVNCNSMAYLLLLKKHYSSALEASLISVEADSSNKLAFTNLALAYLFNKEHDKALAVYTKYKDLPFEGYGPVYQTFKDAFKDDLNEFMKRKMEPPFSDEILRLLNK
jgi:WD40 repeat protein